MTQNNKKIICPACGYSFTSSNPIIGDIIRCPSCTLDLKVIGREPVTVVVDDSWDNDNLDRTHKKGKVWDLNRELKKEAVWED